MSCIRAPSTGHVPGRKGEDPLDQGNGSPHDVERHPAGGRHLAAVADQLERVIAEGEPQKTKALLRLLIEELRVEGRAQIQATYRLVTPEVCATSEKVGAPGIEPGRAAHD